MKVLLLDDELSVDRVGQISYLYSVWAHCISLDERVVDNNKTMGKYLLVCDNCIDYGWIHFVGEAVYVCGGGGGRGGGVLTMWPSGSDSVGLGMSNTAVSGHHTHNLNMGQYFPLGFPPSLTTCSKVPWRHLLSSLHCVETWWGEGLPCDTEGWKARQSGHVLISEIVDMTRVGVIRILT